MDVTPYKGGHFEKIGSEEAHTIETYERRVHGTPHSEPHRQISTNQYTERRTYGRGENGEIIVKIEKNPSDPVRPATPVQPIEHINEDTFANKILKPIQPLHIPRIDIQQENSSNNVFKYYDEVSPRSCSISFASPRSAASHSSRSGAASKASNSSVPSNALPIKKVTKKTRLVSIHDGSPVSPFKDTVSYEVSFPISSERYSSASARSISSSPHRDARRYSDCAFIMENPAYHD